MTTEFSLNVYSEDGRCVVCDECFAKASKAFAAGSIIEATEQTKAAFAEFMDYQHRIKGL